MQIKRAQTQEGYDHLPGRDSGEMPYLDVELI